MKGYQPLEALFASNELILQKKYEIGCKDCVKKYVGPIGRFSYTFIRQT